MKKSKYVLLSVAFFLCLTKPALAQDSSSSGGLYIEPGVTYELGNWTINWPSPFDNSTGKTSGIGLNIKLGAHIADSFFAGLDGSLSKPTFKDEKNNYEAPATATALGAIIGAQMPIVGLRLWGGYIFTANLDPDKDDGINAKFEEGSGFKVGAGFHVSMISLNLEYQMLEYKKTRIEELGPFTVNDTFGSTKLKNDSVILSVSLPLTL